MFSWKTLQGDLPAEMHQVNCLLETFFDAAIEDAKQLDAYFSEHKSPIGPLHGLPVSLKDQFHVKGVETSMGYIGKDKKLSMASNNS